MYTHVPADTNGVHFVQSIEEEVSCLSELSTFVKVSINSLIQ